MTVDEMVFLLAFSGRDYLVKIEEDDDIERFFDACGMHGIMWAEGDDGDRMHRRRRLMLYDIRARGCAMVGYQRNGLFLALHTYGRPTIRFKDLIDSPCEEIVISMPIEKLFGEGGFT